MTKEIIKNRKRNLFFDLEHIMKEITSIYHFHPVLGNELEYKRDDKYNPLIIFNKDYSSSTIYFRKEPFSNENKQMVILSNIGCSIGINHIIIPDEEYIKKIYEIENNDYFNLLKEEFDYYKDSKTFPYFLVFQNRFDKNSSYKIIKSIIDLDNILEN